MRRIATGILTFVFVAGSAAVVRADSIFNFEDLGVGTTTAFPILETNNGVTASFSSPTEPGAFNIDVNPSGLGSGLRLIQTDATATGLGAHLVSLTVAFDQQFQSANLPFAILAATGSNPQLTLQAFLGGTPVGSISTSTSTDISNNPAYSGGVLTFSPGTAFDSFQLNSNFPGFAIDELSLSTSAVSGVPEPASLALLMSGMAATLAFLRRRQGREAA